MRVQTCDDGYEHGFHTDRDDATLDPVDKLQSRMLTDPDISQVNSAADCGRSARCLV